MKKIALILIALAIILMIGFLLDNKRKDIANYPHSDLIFRKYYPANEILGMAHDKSQHAIYSSTDSFETINQWYDQTFSGDRLVENNSDSHCSHKTWQQGEIVKLRTIICDHGDYRTILTITSP